MSSGHGNGSNGSNGEEQRRDRPPSGNPGNGQPPEEEKKAEEKNQDQVFQDRWASAEGILSRIVRSHPRHPGNNANRDR